MKKDNTTKTEENSSELGNVDQIREILFGSQSRDLDERFEKIESSLKSIQDEMRSKIEQNQNDFDERISVELETIGKKIKNVVSSQQDEFADIRDSALKQEKRINSSLETLEDELNSKREQLQRQQIEMRNTIRTQMDSLQDELLSVLEKKFTEIGEVKLSRDDAAEILMEAAMAMKGTKVSQQLSAAQAQTK